jgi:hypothetical protein
MINVFMDDVRPCPEGWVVARTIADAMWLLLNEQVVHMSLDHDMGACKECREKGLHVGDMQTPETTFMNWCPHDDDGSALVRWMIDSNHWPVYKPTVHSANPVGAARMRGMIERYGPYGNRP